MQHPNRHVTRISSNFQENHASEFPRKVGELAGIAVGSAVCITSILAGPISGGSMNPARTMGPGIVSGYYKGFWVYAVCPVCGTLLGAWSYSFIRV